MSYLIESKPSPNFGSRDGALIRLLCLHATVGSYTSSLAWMRNPQPEHPDLRVSTHYLIRKDGHIARLVADSDAAWHAGKSAWRGLDSMEIMQCSLGVELENANTGADPYSDVQLDAATWLCRQLVARYRIAPEFVVRHLDIALPAGRKTDPAGLPWPAFRAGLFAPVPVAYRVVGTPVFESSTRTGKLWGRLTEGEHVIIDDMKNLHLADGRGFLKSLDDLEPV